MTTVSVITTVHWTIRENICLRFCWDCSTGAFENGHRYTFDSGQSNLVYLVQCDTFHFEFVKVTLSSEIERHEKVWSNPLTYSKCVRLFEMRKLFIIPTCDKSSPFRGPVQRENGTPHFVGGRFDESEKLIFI